MSNPYGRKGTAPGISSIDIQVQEAIRLLQLDWLNKMMHMTADEKAEFLGELIQVRGRVKPT